MNVGVDEQGESFYDSAMGRITVLDPTAPPPQDEAGPGPDAGEIAGRVIGFRSDRTWRSFEWVIDEWAHAMSDHCEVIRLDVMRPADVIRLDRLIRRAALVHLNLSFPAGKYQFAAALLTSLARRPIS